MVGRPSRTGADVQRHAEGFCCGGVRRPDRLTRKRVRLGRHQLMAEGGLSKHSKLGAQTQNDRLAKPKVC